MDPHSLNPEPKDPSLSIQEEPRHSHEQRTRWVVYMAAVTMVLEIFFGYWTQSMALLADGWHMASHVMALGLSWLAYFVSRKYSQNHHFSFNKNKLMALSGFSSAILLLIVALGIVRESIGRLYAPLPIMFQEALWVSFIGLAVNGVSAYFLHPWHGPHDHNIRSAYFHVLADVLTSVIAIVALTVGMFYQWYYVDSLSGLIGSAIIAKWALSLANTCGRELVDFKKSK